jgi:hypothetical protein
MASKRVPLPDASTAMRTSRTYSPPAARPPGRIRGYIPDGHGATYRGTTLSGGETVMVDDDLVIYLTRTFAEI